MARRRRHVPRHPGGTNVVELYSTTSAGPVIRVPGPSAVALVARHDEYAGRATTSRMRVARRERV